MCHHRPSIPAAGGNAKQSNGKFNHRLGNRENIFNEISRFRAEKRFKQILDNFDQPIDHLQVVNGQLVCKICGESNFSSQRQATEHVNKQHDTKSFGDFEGSDSDSSVKQEDESTETEDSSGDESSEIEASDEDASDDNDEFVSSKKARTSMHETQEVKHGRAIITEYVETLRTAIEPKTIRWTQQL